MSLAAFSVLIVAFLCLTGEAHVVPKNSANQSSLPSPATTLETPSSSQNTFTTSYNQEDSRIPEYRVPRLSLTPPEGTWTDIPRAEWSDRVLAEWCYGGEDHGDQTSKEKDAEMRVRYEISISQALLMTIRKITNYAFVYRSMLCRMQNPSIAHLGTLDMQTP